MAIAYCFGAVSTEERGARYSDLRFSAGDRDALHNNSQERNMSGLEFLQRTSLPPPPAAFTLLDGTGTIGWIVGHRLGFTGFSSVAEAGEAAWIAHQALERRAAKSRGEPAGYLEPTAMQLVRSDGTEWIESAETRLARLIRPEQRAAEDSDNRSEPWFGIEVGLQPDASELTIGSSAHVVYRALRRSGMRWPIRDRVPLTDGSDGNYQEGAMYSERTGADTQAHEEWRVVMPDQPKASTPHPRDVDTDDVDSASQDSFPASDPPKWSSLRLGPPFHSDLAAALTEEKKDEVE
jgi:hypothetical protein